MRRLGDCTWSRIRGYGFLFPVAGRKRRQEWHRDIQTLAQIEGGVVNRQVLSGGPQVQSIARAAAFEAVEGVGVGVDAEATGGAARGAVQGTGAALLSGMVGTWHEAEQSQDLGDGDGGPHRLEVEGGT